jgi:S-adenosylmethionine:tRNA ribosyltransferase-isomerase
MKTSDFDYQVPESLIAQFPSEKRDECRLLSLDRKSHGTKHYLFKDLPGLLRPGDRLIFNNTKVVPARLRCRKETGGAIELLFTERIDALSWKALVRPAKKMRKNTALSLAGEPRIQLNVNEVPGDGSAVVTMADTAIAASIDDLLHEYGEMPLPPYIKRKPIDSDADTYQTVFARRPGAIASPTAGLHFTGELMERLKQFGVDFSFVTLHVGIGTFRPVKSENPRDHEMHQENYELSSDVAEALIDTRKKGGRNIAVGTTVVRVLEHCSQETGYPSASTGATRLMILPGHSFKVIDGLITNFHVPRSTLLMLVSAFAGTEHVLKAYEEAVRLQYRFFSYGDAMIIL